MKMPCLLVCWLAAILLIGLPATTLAAQQSIQCKSQDFRYQVCAAKIRGKVKLLEQTSQAPCRLGRTWGYNKNGIWVDEGCSGRFAILPRGGRGDRNAPIYDGGNSGGSSKEPIYDGGQQATQRVICKSSNFTYRLCRLKHAGKVRLDRQLSSRPCRLGRTWGYNERGIWVDAGCSAEFLVARADPERRRKRLAKQVSCASRDFRYHYCRVTTGGEVKLSKRTSNAPCIEGRTWGFDRTGIWVDEGCAARFIVGAEPIFRN